MEFNEPEFANNTSTTPITPTESSRFIAHEIVFSLFAMVAIVANCLIIYTVFRFKRMRIAPYMFIASWAIADLGSSLLVPSGLQIVSIMENIRIPYEVFCVFSQTGGVLHGGSVLFVTIVAIDWLLAAYFPRASGRFRGWYKVVLVVLWTFILTLAVFSDVECWLTWFAMIIPLFFVGTTLVIVYLVVIGVQIARLVQKIRKRPSEYPGLGINLTTAFIGCWTLAYLNILFAANLFAAHPIMLIISLCLVYSSSVINFGLLYRFNNDFNACVRQVLSCRRVKYEEDLSEGARIQSNLDTNSVRIQFGNSGLAPRSGNARNV